MDQLLKSNTRKDQNFLLRVSHGLEPEPTNYRHNTNSCRRKHAVHLLFI